MGTAQGQQQPQQLYQQPQQLYQQLLQPQQLYQPQPQLNQQPQQLYQQLLQPQQLYQQPQQPHGEEPFGDEDVDRLVVSDPSSTSSLTPNEVRLQIDEANKLFESGHYEQAKKLYAGMQQSGVINGHVFYRLALFYRPGRYMVGQRNTKLSLCYLHKALPLLELRAKDGDYEAQADLAYMYDLGLGVPSDMNEAIKLYMLAADGGMARAQFNLGHMYKYGTDLPLDKKKALYYFRLAADQGDAEASYNAAEIAFELNDYDTSLRYHISAAPQWPASLKRCKEIFSGGVSEDFTSRANVYISTHLPYTWPMIEPSCKEVILYIMFMSKVLYYFPVELAYVIFDRIIRSWRIPHSFQVVQSTASVNDQQMSRRTDGQLDGRPMGNLTDGRTDGLTEGRKDEKADGQLYGQTEGGKDEKTDGQLDGRTEGGKDERTDGQTDGWTDGWMD